MEHHRLLLTHKLFVIAIDFVKKISQNKKYVYFCDLNEKEIF